MEKELLTQEVQDELVNNILPFWMHRMTDEINGGFYGRITGENRLVPEADKGAVLNARILWTFSSAYRLLHDEAYLVTATRAKRFIIDSFYDHEQGGVYWALDYKGNPVDTKKQIYAQAFAIYGLSEYHRATGDDEALHYAQLLFESIETHAFDPVYDGYFEAFTRDWQPLADMRLSDKDKNACKTMNTHIHIFEAYANLFRVWKEPRLEQQLRHLVDILCNHIYDEETYQLMPFFDKQWNKLSGVISPGHNIEASWLIYETRSMFVKDALLAERMERLSMTLYLLALSTFDFATYSMPYEVDSDDHLIDAERHWWVQAELVTGIVSYSFMDKQPGFIKMAYLCWGFIKKHLIDHVHGEWHWSVSPDGTINTVDDKAGFWKCPYHNGRMCMKVMEWLK
ncbi:MAG: AGE family epimerase/isomerase [Mediterranea sp.]|nr:AGE family epimerase/isomerase [Mediterranea sp.]